MPLKEKKYNEYIVLAISGSLRINFNYFVDKNINVLPCNKRGYIVPQSPVVSAPESLANICRPRLYHPSLRRWSLIGGSRRPGV